MGMFHRSWNFRTETPASENGMARANPSRLSADQ